MNEFQKFLVSLKDSFTALRSEPKLFLPKIVLALLWGILLLLIAEKAVRLFSIRQFPPAQIAEQASLIFSEVAWLFILFVGMFLADVFVNAAYPYFIERFYRNEKISLISGFAHISRNSLSYLAPIVLSFLVSILALIPFVFLFSFALLSRDLLFIALSLAILLAVVFGVSFFFYFVYPIAVIEKKGLLSLFASIKSAKKNFCPVSLAVVITMSLSLVTVFLAVSYRDILAVGVSALILFFVLRIVNAMIATYQMVLNPVLYLEFEKNRGLEK